MKAFVLAFTVSFFFFLLFSMSFTQVETNALTETRRAALAQTLSRGQLDSGAFHFYTNISGTDYSNEGSTFLGFMSLNILNATDQIDAQKVVAYLASKQMNGSGGFGGFYHDGKLRSYDMEFNYMALHVLKVLNGLDRINRTAAADFLMARYNQPTGAFQELLTDWNGTQLAMSHFSIEGPLFQWAYAVPNIISTYFGVSALADLGMLQLINVTKTLEWIRSSQGVGGAFMPYPRKGITYPVAGLSPELTPVFMVDWDDQGVPYTFAAVEALKNLGHLSDLSVEDRNKIREYILSCQDQASGNFKIFWEPPGYSALYSAFDYSYYAIVTLSDINEFNESETAVSTLLNRLEQIQLLRSTNSFPLPDARSSAYGLFHDTSTDALEDTFYAVSILNATSNLSLLDERTPRSTQTIINMVILSVLVASASTATIWGYAEIKKRKKNATIRSVPNPDSLIN